MNDTEISDVMFTIGGGGNNHRFGIIKLIKPKCIKFSHQNCDSGSNSHSHYTSPNGQ